MKKLKRILLVYILNILYTILNKVRTMSKPTSFNDRLECVWINPHVNREIEGTVSRVQYDYAKQDHGILFYPSESTSPVEKLLVPFTQLRFKKHKQVSENKIYVASFGLLRLQDSEDSRLLRDAIKRKVATIRLKDYQLYVPPNVFYPVVTYEMNATVVVDILEFSKEDFLFLHKKETARGMNLEILRMFLPDEGKVEVGIFTFKNRTWGLDLCNEEFKGPTGDYILDRITFLRKKATDLMSRHAL